MTNTDECVTGHRFMSTFSSKAFSCKSNNVLLEQTVIHLVSQFCVYILYVLLLHSCSASDWQPGIKPGKYLSVTQDVSRWPCVALVFLSTPLDFPNVIRKAAQVLCVCALVFELLRGRCVCILLNDVHFHSVTIMFHRGKWWILNSIKSLQTQDGISDDEGKSTG